jgi:antitoxin HicB
MTLAYHVEFTPDDNGTVMVTCPALPEVTTFGENEADALAHAVGAIEEALAGRIADGQDLPYGSKGTPSVHLPAQTALKVQLYRTLRAAGITRAELARRLDWNRESVDRLFRLDHNSRLDQLESAFRALNREIDIRVRELAW